MIDVNKFFLSTTIKIPSLISDKKYDPLSGVCIDADRIIFEYILFNILWE